MRIAFIVSRSKGTITKVTMNLIAKLEKDFAIKIILICLNYEKEGSLIENVKDRYLLDNAKGIFKYFKYINFIRKVIKKENVQLCVSSENAPTAYMILSNLSIKKIGIFHAPVWQSRNNGLGVYLMDMISLKLLYTRLDKIICVSASAATVFNSKKKEVIYNVHDIDYIREKAAEPLNNEEIKLFDKNNILMLGDVEPNKCQVRAILAFHKIHSFNSNSKLVIMGNITDSQYFEFLKGLVYSLGLEKNVLFEKFNTNPYKFVNNSKMVLSTSISEGLPGVLIEAAILGVPFISTNSSTGIWEILQVEDKYIQDLDNNYYVDYNTITPNNYNNFTTNPNIKDNALLADVEAIVTAYKNNMHKEYDNVSQLVDISRFQNSANKYYEVIKELVELS